LIAAQQSCAIQGARREYSRAAPHGLQLFYLLLLDVEPGCARDTRARRAACVAALFNSRRRLSPAVKAERINVPGTAECGIGPVSSVPSRSEGPPLIRRLKPCPPREASTACRAQPSRLAGAHLRTLLTRVAAHPLCAVTPAMSDEIAQPSAPSLKKGILKG